MITDAVCNLDVPATLEAARPTRDPLAFHQRLPGYAPTALIESPELAQRLGVAQVWIKNEAARMHMPAYKILGASWAVYRALNERMGGNLTGWHTLDELAQQVAPLKPLTLTAATDGNHGRAVARMAKLLGLGAHILVPAGTADARIEGIQSENARVTVVDGTYDDAVRQAAAEASNRCAVIADTSWEGYTAVPTWVIEGYSTIFWEIDDELERRQQPGPTLVLVQTGVGALAAAVVRHYRRPGLRVVPRIVNVEPSTAACVMASMQAGHLVEVPGPHTSIMAGLNCGLPSLIAWPLVSQGINAYLAISDDAARQGMRDLAEAGIVAGESGAAGMGGLLALLHSPDAAAWHARLEITPDTRVLLLVTEGATDPAAYQEIVGTGA